MPSSEKEGFSLLLHRRDLLGTSRSKAMPALQPHGPHPLMDDAD
jgi:hypothetical protein